MDILSTRRQFLGRISALVGALAMPRILEAQTCEATSQDAIGMGPFYAPDAPLRTSSLADPSEPGTRLVISGIVSDCHGPLQGVRIEVWQANLAGCYSVYAEQTCDDTIDLVNTGRLRGIFTTDAQGRYGFTTIYPGAYRDGGGGKYRTPHIHYRITIPGDSGQSVPLNSGLSTELITQLYFQDAPYLDIDDGASDAQITSGMQRIIALTPSAGGGLEGTFDIVMPSSTAILRQGRAGPESLNGFDVLVLRNGREVRFVLPPNRLPGILFLSAISPDGKVCHRERRWGREIVWDASGLSSGVYMVELRSSHSRSQESIRVIL